MGYREGKYEKKKKEGKRLIHTRSRTQDTE